LVVRVRMRAAGSPQIVDEQALAPAQNGVFTTAMLRELRRFVKLQPLHGILQSSH
jgi:hypothetical protein